MLLSISIQKIKIKKEIHPPPSTEYIFTEACFALIYNLAAGEIEPPYKNISQYVMLFEQTHTRLIGHTKGKEMPKPQRKSRMVGARPTIDNHTSGQAIGRYRYL